MNYKELYLETKEMLEEFDFIGDKKYKSIYDIPRYAFYLYMKRNHPERIIEDGINR